MIPVVLSVGPALAWQPLPLEGEPPRDGLARIGGAAHVHTTLSDGAGTPEDVAQAGREAGLSFLALTDHDGTASRFDEYHDGMLVLMGAEFSTNQGHLLGLAMQPRTFPLARDARNAIDDVRYLDGAAFVAHPTSPRKDLAWSGWEAEGPWGLEILNMDSLWRQASWPELLGGLLAYPFDPVYAVASVLERPTAVIARWDELLRLRNVAGLAGVDAHGRLFQQGEFLPDFSSYDSLFRVLRTYVVLDSSLSGEATRDTTAVRDALARGRSYMAVEAIAPAGEFFFHAARGDRTWQMGDTARPAPDLLLRSGGRLPRGARVALYLDGKRIAVGRGALEFPARTAGTYRVEVNVTGWDVPWIVSNPIYVYEAAEEAVRARSGASPADHSAPVLGRSLDAFEEQSALIAESDGATWVDPEVRVPSERDPGGAAARLRFRLAEPGPERPSIWGALVDRTSRDLSGDTGLVFDVRADGVYRVRVGLWVERPGEVDGEPDWWLSSIRTSTDWSRREIPFDRLYPAVIDAEQALELQRVVGLLFYIDPATDFPVTEGTIWFDRLGTY